MVLNTLSSGLAILFLKLYGNLLNICNSFYLAEGSDSFVRGSDVRFNILLDVEYLLKIFN